MPQVPINGIELYYEEHGEGPALVFAHGAAGNHMSWWQQVPFFRRQYRCITFDHRGFGRSLDQPDAPGARLFVADLAALLDHLGIEQCALVGQSMGGRTVFGFALAYPQRVRALVMADTVAGIPSKALQEARQALRERQAGEEVSLARDAYSRRFPERDPARAFLYEQIRGLNPPRVTSPEGATPPAEAEVDLSTFSVPTLFIFGSEDRLAPPELGRLAHKLIPNSRYVEVEEAGHSVYFERPEEFNRIVAEFLRQHQ